jgi:hypothetical protein
MGNCKMRIFIFLTVIFMSINTPSQIPDVDDVDLYELSSIREALECGGGWGIQRYAAEWIAIKLGLDWPNDHKPIGAYGKDIRGYVSNSRKYCVLVGANYGEWGPRGKANYCFIRDDGTILWQREALICHDPKVSNLGCTAIIYRPQENDTKIGDRLDYYVEIIDSSGNTAHVKEWYRHVEREMERGGSIRECYGFTLDGELFFMTMNVFSESKAKEGQRHKRDKYNNTQLYLLDLTSWEIYEHELGNFSPGTATFPNSSSVIIDGFWRNWFKDQTQYFGDYVISDKGKKIEKRVFEILIYD